MVGIPAFTVCIWSWLLVLQRKANGQRDSIQENTGNGIDGKTDRTDLLWPERQCAEAGVGVFVVETEDSSLCLHGICSTSCLRE